MVLNLVTNSLNWVIVPLCIILPTMSGWMKYFENGGKNMSFKMQDDKVYLKYNEVWNKIKELLGGLKFSSEPIYDDNYFKTKVKTFNEVVGTLFDGDSIPKEKMNILVFHALVLILC